MVYADSARDQIAGLTEGLTRLLGANLIGIYLHGSLALGGFNPQHSDIDLLIVVHTSLPPDIKHEVARLVLASSRNPHPLELSILTDENLYPWRYPTPFDFHYSEAWRERTQQEFDNGSAPSWADAHDPDLAGHITIVNHCGIVLAGKPIAEALPPVPRTDYLTSVLNDVLDAPEYIHTNPVYWILNPCRVYWYLLEGRISSKEEAGAWAVDYLPEPYCAVVRQALASYRGEINDKNFDLTGLQQYAAFITKKIREANSQGTDAHLNGKLGAGFE